jgi:nucleoside-diphosphate-sugar epimerase
MEIEQFSPGKLVIGCGYLGERVAQCWLAEGVPVTVLTRSASRAEQLSAAGFLTVIGDVLQPESLEQLPAVQTVLYAVGFDRSAGASKREVYVTGLQNVLTVLQGRCRKLLYVSSTSVYGQHDGELVDEMSPTEPTAEDGCICRDAEAVVQQFFPRDAHEIPGAVILRLAGLYGPGRLAARLDKLRRGERLEGSAAAWLNLIHVDDAVQAVLAAEKFGRPGECYLICDDQPVRRGEYFAELTRQLGLPAPVFELPETNTVPSPPLNKRCSNRRMHRELNVELRYPTFAEGLKSIPELRH